MVRRRTRTELIVAGCIVVAVPTTMMLFRGSSDEIPVTQERLAEEVYGDADVATCIYDGMKAADIDPIIYNDLLNDGLPDGVAEPELAPGEVEPEIPDELLDRISDIALACSPVVIESSDASGEDEPAGQPGGQPEQAGADGTSADGASTDDRPAPEEPKPILRIADDGSAEVVWVPSAELDRVDPDIPELASNR